MKRFVCALLTLLMLLSVVSPMAETASAASSAKVPSKVTLGVGETYKLDIDDAKFKSSDKSVASVSKKGVITAKAEGTATITVTKGKKTLGECKVKVAAAPSKVSLSDKKLTLAAGGTAKLTAKLPSGSASHITWSSSDASVAKVSSKGQVTAVAPGKAKITAETFNGKTASCTVTVADSSEDADPEDEDGEDDEYDPNANVTGIKLPMKTITIGVKEKVTVKPTLTPEGVTSKLTWKSGDTSVAKVKKGKITGVGSGSTKITVTTKNGKKATLKVKVQSAPSKVTMSKKKATVYMGETYKLKAKLPKKTASYKMTWTSSNTAVATVDQNGLVTPVAPGTAKITVKTFNKKKATCTVTVKYRTSTDYVMSDGVITGYTGPGGDIVLPNTDYDGNTIVTIAASAFEGNTTITGVTLPETLKTIESRAFAGCSGLTEVQFPKSVNYIAEDAFDAEVTFACTLNSYAYYFAVDSGRKLNILGNFDVNSVRYQNSKFQIAVTNSAACTLRVDILYDDESQSIYDYQELTLAEGPEGQNVEIDESRFSLPTYYGVRVTLQDSYGNTIGDPYTYLGKTQAYAAFLERTAADYPQDRVLNYDQSGFAVLDDDVTVLDGSRSGDTYTINSQNPVSVGDVFYLPNIGEMVKVRTVTDNGGGSYTITPDPDASLTDFYKYLRYDTTFDAMNQLANNGRIARNAVSAPNIGFDAEWARDLAQYTKTVESGPFSATVKVGAAVSCSFHLDVALFGPDYLESEAYVSVAGSAEYAFTSSYSYENSIPVYHGDIPIGIPGLFVDIDISVPIKFKAEASLTFTSEFEAKMGFNYSTSSGLRRIRETTFRQHLNANGKITASAGPQIDLGISAGGVLTAAVGAQFGLELTADTTLIDIDTAQQPESKHECTLCFDVDVKKFVDLSASLKASVGSWYKREFFRQTWPVYRDPIFEGYLSVINGADSCHHGQVTLGEGECPNRKYRTIIKTFDENGDEVTGKSVTIKKQQDGAWAVVSTGTSPYTTYLLNGNYEAETVFNGETAKQAFIINSAAADVKLQEKGKGTIVGTVVDARTGESISGATVVCGDYTTYTDSYGEYSLEVPTDIYPMTISKAEYNSSNFTVVVEANQTVRQNAALVKRNEGEVIVVLRWGETPRDLDSHLEWASGHVCYWNMNEGEGSLDVDDVTSYGPETVAFTPQRGVTYTYYVHDYTNRNDPTSYAMGYSGATVEITFADGSVVTRHVPVGGMGTKWVVFTYCDGVVRYGSSISNAPRTANESYPEKK